MRNCLRVNALFLAILISPTVHAIESVKCDKILAEARGFVERKLRYVPNYVRISYPDGDVPKDTGVCTDVVVRSLRATGLDLQKAVHEDMEANFSKYPQLWGMTAADKNIDHRRVPNLITYFKGHVQSLPPSESAGDYWPCDIVTWDLGGGVTHIGIVSDKKNWSGKPLILHHFGGETPKEENRLFAWKITGHFRL